MMVQEQGCHLGMDAAPQVGIAVIAEEPERFLEVFKGKRRFAEVGICPSGIVQHYGVTPSVVSAVDVIGEKFTDGAVGGGGHIAFVVGLHTQQHGEHPVVAVKTRGAVDGVEDDEGGVGM